MQGNSAHCPAVNNSLDKENYMLSLRSKIAYYFSCTRVWNFALGFPEKIPAAYFD
jgi:hypothetical protein